MTATGTGALREQAAEALWYASQEHFNKGLEPVGFTDWRDADAGGRAHMLTQADRVLAAIAEAGLAPAGGTLTADIRAAVEHMVDGIDTSDDRNVVRRWLGR